MTPSRDKAPASLLVAAAMGAAVVLAAVLPLAGAAPAAKPAAAPAAAAVDSAIRRGLAFVFSQQSPDGQIPTRHANTHPGAVEALAVLTALAAGADPAQQNVAAAIDHVRRTHPQTVCARAMRVIMLGRLGGRNYLKQIEQDVTWLMRNRNDRLGGWGGGPGHPASLYRPERTDTVNSHLAILALAEADEVGVAVPQEIWKQSRAYWTKAQGTDGGWGYEPRSDPAARVLQDSFATTTAAGMDAVLALERKRLELSQAQPGGIGTGNETAAMDRTVLDAAGAWLTAHYDLQSIPGSPLGKGDGWYYPYLLSFVQVAESGGRRLVGRDPWLPRVTTIILGAQGLDGHWPAADGTTADQFPPARQSGHDVIRTCLATLALVRCRGGLLVNKLVLRAPTKKNPLAAPGALDAHNLARWYERNCGQAVGWRLIGPEDTHEQFAQAPILYINVRESFTMPKAFADKAIYYVRNGGTILVHVQGINRALARQAGDYFLGLLGDYHSARVTDDHPIYHIRFEIPPDKQPDVTGIGDYCRTRIFIVSGDLPRAWHCNLHKTRPEAFRLVGNMALYGTNGRAPGSKFHRRRPRPPKPKRHIAIARVFHEGDWNTNPLASVRLSDVLSDALSIGVDERPATKLAAPPPHELVMLWLTGTRLARLGVEHRLNLKQYITKGGTLLVDPATGNEKFFNDAKAMLEEMFGDKFKRADADSAILTGSFAGGAGADVTTVRYTTSPSTATPKKAPPEIWQVEIDGRIAVVLSRHGLACPVEGLPTYGCKGLARDDARRLVANVVLYAAWQRRPKR